MANFRTPFGLRRFGRSVNTEKEREREGEREESEDRGTFGAGALSEMTGRAKC
jgi:hypothetical protein